MGRLGLRVHEPGNLLLSMCTFGPNGPTDKAASKGGVRVRHNVRLEKSPRKQLRNTETQPSLLSQSQALRKRSASVSMSLVLRVAS